MSDIDQCPECDASVNWNDYLCPDCDYVLGAPNLRELQTEDEIQALKQRYDRAVTLAAKKGLASQCQAFEQAIKADAKVVMNIDTAVLECLLTSDKSSISNYNLQTRGETRLVAKMDNDKKRRGIEGTLFGVYAEKIRYGVLSLEHQGLLSYGHCCVTFKEQVMKKKVSLLEENSYDFVRHHKVIAGDEITPGYRARWCDRHMLVIAKLGNQLNTKTINFAPLLLSSGGDRQKDQFIEVHIYGQITSKKITYITLPDGKQLDNARDVTRLNWIKDHAVDQGIDYVIQK